MPVGRAAKDGGAEDAAGATSMPSLHPLTRMVSHPNKPDKAGEIRSAGPVGVGSRLRGELVQRPAVRGLVVVTSSLETIARSRRAQVFNRSLSTAKTSESWRPVGCVQR